MNRTRIALLLVGLLCVAGLAVAAATVENPRQSAAGAGTGSGDGDGVGSGEGQLDRSPSEDFSTFGIPAVFRWVAFALFVIGALAAIYIAVRDFRVDQFVAMGLALCVVLCAVAVLIWLLGDADTGTQFGDLTQNRSENVTGGGGTGGNDQSQQFDVPIALMGAFGVLALVLVGTITRFAGSETAIPTGSETEPEAESDDQRVRAVGEAAGRAADRLDDEETTVSNTVVEAWTDMTDALEVRRPESTTPEEFAEAAIDAGLAADDVRELTWLFEAVRYGDAPVTEERERRAQDALRRIEAAYAEADDE